MVVIPCEALSLAGFRGNGQAFALNPDLSERWSDDYHSFQTISLMRGLLSKMTVSGFSVMETRGCRSK